jgi:hypothetical protein
MREWFPRSCAFTHSSMRYRRDGGQERPLGGQRLADDPFRRAVAACGDDLGRPAPGSGVALGADFTGFGHPVSREMDSPFRR